ncbi:MAG TPA: methylated-DNA--[protein]-cysteine S-methyltransferase [Bacteroidia bacterium]|nr:methylated-DNA--[protein]-cysteine S-methyltransferase [Bacteroidia bacterium]
MISNQEMYTALVNKDSAYEGTFIAAVKTTGIFCRPTCTARKPKSENVEFFTNTKEALLNGYRPCKVCKPLENPDQTPKFIQEILSEMSADPSLKFKDYDLIKRDIEPSQMRRWFLKHHGMTFHAFQRIFRINAALKKIQSGESVTDTAFDSGYESLSGFNDSFKAVLGVSPKNSMYKMILDLARVETPLGPMYACADKEGICLLEFTDRKMLETEFKLLKKKFKADIVYGANKHLEQLKEELEEYFNGTRQTFSVALSLVGTEFQKQVWNELINIPYGTTRSYSQQATALGKQSAIRAIAQANGMNKISIVVPCHRVIGSHGQLTGYGGGLWRKKWLLDLERRELG